ncbi:DENN domain-containing protein 11-like [Saccostrea echinata]|uniref:DENN domain-containing protein 11-like n=1 Tax=Saccostrea echinata TaxID=191078 RepID=UPI002A80ECEB|nr:DENN domain-containing protein 11-like [Saccostrea echinata]
MADDEKSPLLQSSDDDEGPRLRHSHTFPTTHRSLDVSSVTPTEEDHIVCVFVVTFDTRSGNMIEWCTPDDFELDGVEFKAMVSGSHTQQKDFVYFRKDRLYGLACYEKMSVESEIERGARMKSVGILSTSYTLLYRHIQFLESQVRHQLELPGIYSQLQAFYNDKKGVLPESASSRGVTPTSTPSTPSSLLPEMKITHPAGCFSQFIKFFGANIFILWKLVLLQKRILFFSPPPIGVVCYKVYCACCLGNHEVGKLGHEVQPHFYVNVADIETLETEVAYIACTTEKIFETKTYLHDVYVDNQVITAHTPVVQELLKLSDADKDKYNKLLNRRSANQFSYEGMGEDVVDEEELITSFFTQQNNDLFSTLLDVAHSHDRQLTSDHMRNMGLDPQGDRTFLMELVEHYGIDVVLMVDNPCCPK